MNDFIQFAAERGLILNSIITGRIKRCPTEDHPHKRNGAYFFDNDWGWIQNWEIHSEPVFWKSDSVSDEEIKKKYELRRGQYDKEREKKQYRAAERARSILSECELSTHPYLERKGFPKTMANVCENHLVIPMYSNNEICGAQTIDESGTKKFLYGQRTNDAVFPIGNGKKQIIVEGYASGLSLQAILDALKIQATIYVTFSVGNATRVARRLPAAIWIADHDHSGIGQEAAAKSGNRWWMPEQEGFDINDLHLAEGLFKASQILRKAILQ